MPAKKTTTKRKSGSPKSDPPPRRLGALDAAAQVLKTVKEPMTCKAIVDAMLKKNLWTTNGKTPHATLYSAIIREITKKGKEARFAKVDRGRFALAGTKTG